jgi:hypothetical protein
VGVWWVAKSETGFTFFTPHPRDGVGGDAVYLSCG